MRVPQCLRDRQRDRNWHWSLDRLLQHQSTALDLRRQDARRGLCYAGRRGEIGGVTETQIHLSQAAKLSRKTDPLLRRALRTERRRARAAHWSYDLKRHLGFLSAYKGELANLGTGSAEQAQPNCTPRAGEAGSGWTPG